MKKSDKELKIIEALVMYSQACSFLETAAMKLEISRRLAEPKLKKLIERSIKEIDSVRDRLTVYFS